MATGNERVYGTHRFGPSRTVRSSLVLLDVESEKKVKFRN